MFNRATLRWSSVMFGYVLTAYQTWTVCTKKNDTINFTAFSIVKNFPVQGSLKFPMNHSMRSDFERLAGSGFQAKISCFCRPDGLRCPRGLSFFSLNAVVEKLEACKGRKGCGALWGVSDRRRRSAEGARKWKAGQEARRRD